VVAQCKHRNDGSYFEGSVVRQLFGSNEGSCLSTSVPDRVPMN
jgi:hypothetical protein